MNLSIMEIWSEFKSSKKIVLLSFLIATVGCLTYSAYFIPQTYMASIEFEMPAKIDINTANTVATILRGNIFEKQGKDDFKIMHAVTLAPSGDIIHIDFSGTDYAKVDGFKGEFIKQGMIKIKGYVAEVYGDNKANQIEIIRNDKNYNGATYPVKTINVYASILLGIVTAFCVLVVNLILKRKNV